MRPPGSKSITNRALLLAALAQGESRITGALKSDDTARMAEALIAMGVGVDEVDAETFVVRSTGRLTAPAGPLHLGNAGTAMRFLTAAAALADGAVTLDGDDAMRRRPIAPLIAALQGLGVAVEATGGCPPVVVQGQGRVAGSRATIDAGLSSQYLSALLMLAPRAQGAVEVALTGGEGLIGARGYVDLTLAAMRRFGAEIEALGKSAWRVAPTGYRAADFVVEPDASAATYVWASEALTGGRIDLGVRPQDFTQPDAQAHALIAAFPHMPAAIDGAQIQDAVPTLAVLAAFNAWPVRFTGIANLRVKECDRISALHAELNRLKPGLASVKGDDLTVHADPDLAAVSRPAEIKTYHDHRIAMSFALAGLRCDGVTILDPGCTAKTWPGYWDALRRLGVELV